MIRLRPSGVDEILIKRVQDWYEPGPGVFIQSLTASFTPASIFTGTTNGAWYDPSDFTTLFQDAAGTQPVTAVEQPVGLMLDKSKGLVLGPELVTNGDFSNGSTGWTGGSVSSGRMVVPLFNESTQAITLVAGRTYQVIFDIDASLGIGRITVGGSIIDLLNTTKVGARYYIAPANTTALRLGCISGTSASFDNISVRELPGNHAFNSSGNSANFPVLSARANLLTKTEQFDDAVWTKASVTVSANSTTAPNGTTTADLIYPLSSGIERLIYNTSPVTTVVGASYVSKFYVKAAGFRWVSVDGTQTNYAAWFDLQTGTVGTVKAGHTASITAVGDGWYLVSVTTASASSTSGYVALRFADADNSTYATASGTSGAYWWGADLRVANDALGQPAYQRVNTSTDYDTVGFKPYLRFNGTNQWLQTNSIDFSYTDKMFVSAGVRKLSDAATAIVLETSVTTDSNNGTFFLLAPTQGTFSGYRFRSKGSVFSDSVVNSGYVAPITNVLSGVGDISGDQSILRVNGTQAAISTADQGTGNYGNYPLYIGARAGTSVWFNGRLYGLLVAGKQASAAEITSTETYINQKTGAY